MNWLKRALEKMERAAMASAYAQAGERDLAREIMEDDDAGNGSES